MNRIKIRKHQALNKIKITSMKYITYDMDLLVFVNLVVLKHQLLIKYIT